MAQVLVPRDGAAGLRMDSTRLLVESLERLLSEAPSTTWVDEFQVLDVRIEELSEALPVLDMLLEDVQKGLIRYERAVVKIESSSRDRVSISHVIRRDENDVLLQRETLAEGIVCDEHAKAYEQALEEQERQFEFESRQRYSLIQVIENCPHCNVHARVEITLDKDYLERRFKESFESDLPQFAGDLEGLRVLYWADLDHLYSLAENNLIQAQNTLAEWGKPCLMICRDNAENNGADYFKSISAAMCVQRGIIEPILSQLLGAPALQPLTRSRQSHIEEYPKTLGYLPPEYWLNAQVLAQAHTGKAIPVWFVKVAPFFVYAMLATVSSKVFINGADLRFEIEREFELSLECSLASDKIIITLGDVGCTVGFAQDVLCELLNFYSVALQAKYTAINHDLVQRSIVYGTDFAFETFFSKLDRIGRFYNFEYKHLLGDRFEQQSRTLSALIADMVSLRQRLASLVDSLSKDLSGLTIAVLATSALAVVARVLDIKTWDNLVVYGLLTTPIFAYLYITVFLLRIDNLKDLGERAADEFRKDMQLGQQIWDFPLHTIGVSEEDLDRETLLRPLLYQHHINNLIAEAGGILSQLLFVALAIGRNLWWLAVPKLIIDSIFLGRAFWVRTNRQSRIIYYSSVWLVTLVFAAIVYWVNYA
jgi:hypothetical protein